MMNAWMQGHWWNLLSGAVFKKNQWPVGTMHVRIIPKMTGPDRVKIFLKWLGPCHDIPRMFSTMHAISNMPKMCRILIRRTDNSWIDSEHLHFVFTVQGSSTNQERDIQLEWDEIGAIILIIHQLSTVFIMFRNKPYFTCFCGRISPTIQWWN